MSEHTLYEGDEHGSKLDDEPVSNIPTLYVDGDKVTQVGRAIFDPSELECVQIEFDDTVNGFETEAEEEAHEKAALGWCNSAAITLERDEDAVVVTISVGDPRGAFAFTVRRLSDGSLVMHTPYPGQPMPHMRVAELQPGTYRIG